jgi:uncharacterized protein YbjT (DUF2867 family)
MKIVVIGGTGLIGSKVVQKLTTKGHDGVAASPGTGVNTLTGEGLAKAVTDSDVVIDVSNSPSFEENAVLEFFRTSTSNLLAAETAAGVRHHVALSVVGTDRLTESAYFRAKIAQESLIRESPIPHTIIRATQFFEFIKGIAEGPTDGDTVHLAPVLIQPMAADDVAALVVGIALGEPINGIVEVAGPEQFGLDELVRMQLQALGDSREVVTDPSALYFGAQLRERTLVPEDGATLSSTRYEDWLGQSPVSTP